MNAFDFSLERVLKVKQQTERLAELRQAQARAHLEAAHEEVVVWQRQFLQSTAQLQTAGNGNHDELSWQASYEQSRQLAAILEAAQERERQAVALLEQANLERRKAAQEVEALLALRRQECPPYEPNRPAPSIPRQV